MQRLLLDTSVLIKWFHSEGESELAGACALRSAHVDGELDGHMLDLAVRGWRRDATLAHSHALPFYDASRAACAAEPGIPLVSADRRLVAAGLAESPTQIAARLKLPPG